MAKELPYFRFTVQEWQNGDIGIESYEIKGLFIDICGFYWIKDCNVNVSILEKRFSNAKDLLKQLYSLDIIKIDNDGNIDIFFLNEQYDLLSEKRKKRQLAGQKGGLMKSSNAKAMLKQNSSYKDKDKENNNNRSFVVDANSDLVEYRTYFFQLIKQKQVSRDVLLKNSRIDLSRRNELWEAFILNAISETPQIEDEKHAWNCFKKFVKDNSKQYQIKESMLNHNWE